MPAKSGAARILNAQLAEANRTDIDGQPVVETFRFEVSAGKGLARPLSGAGPSVATKPPPNSLIEPVCSSRLEALPFGASTPAKKRRKIPSWLGSGAFHLALLPFGLMTIPEIHQSFDFTLSLSADPGIVEEVAVEEVTIEPLLLESSNDQLATQVMQASFTAEDLNAEAALSELMSSSLAEAAVSDVSGMIGAKGMSDLLPSGDKLTASFFGTKVDGRRILYVLDNSGGMQDGGLETLIDELLQSVESLSAKQEFYVIFYSDMVYPMFHPRGVERFVPANDRFKQRLKSWLDSVEFCVGNSVDEAVQTASMIGPDAVYLLTDGNIDTTRDGRKLDALLDARGRDFPIHTFGIGMGEHTKAADNLRLVAEANNGTFRVVDVTPQAKARAKEMNRPYHSKEAGRDWGLKVGRGWGRK